MAAEPEQEQPLLSATEGDEEPPRPAEMQGPVLDVDMIITRLLSFKEKPGKQINLPENQIRQLCARSREIFLSQSMLLELAVPVVICGDLHGQYEDLLRYFDKVGSPPDTNFLFLGDYVDRGKLSLETICLLMAYKVKYPENIFLLRGNHESSSINRIYGFYDECKRRYSIKLWKTFGDCFNCLPLAALVEDTIFCMHGGLSPDLSSLDQVRELERPLDVPDKGLVCDLLWSDPDIEVLYLEYLTYPMLRTVTFKEGIPLHRSWGDNDRGVSVTFGLDIIRSMSKRLGIDLICRAHQVVEDGYEFLSGRQLVTVFSAPNYCGEFDNAGACLQVDKNLLCSFSIIPPKTTAEIVKK